jgi:glutamate-1-semialdehyde 2,1-aminomutase
MTTIAIVQARMGSTRLPGKVMREIGGTPLIGLLLARLSQSTRLDRIVVATTALSDDDALALYVRSLGYMVFRGSESDVLDRFYQAARATDADTIVRITGDCPLVDAGLVDAVVERLESLDVEYASNTETPGFPDGLDVEAFRFAALERVWRSALSVSDYDREHVTPAIIRGAGGNLASVPAPEDLSSERWTVDEPEDLEVITSIFNYFYPNTCFGWQEVLELKHALPHLFAPNNSIKRDEGATMGTGQKLWKRARRVIPSGNMLLSKRPEMILPGAWPTYYSKAKGCKIWDLDGREYIDMSLMGVGTNILGYGHPEIDEAVVRTVESGNMSTLNCPEEVYLAERLIEMHPWAQMVKLARSGGEANAIAVRIARAAAGRDKVAICGYHGWHDWYLSANIADDQNLDGHLLPGLTPRGVPRNLRDTVFPFAYNKFDELQQLVDQHDLGVIKMEVVRDVQPENGFLRKVRELASRNNIVLILDECTSGFRESFGGIHLRYDIEPDLAVFGKALGNGYAITAVIGRESVMEAARETFISSTFWTERIGPTAALKTLEVMHRTRAWEYITAVGQEIGDRWLQLGTHFGLDVRIEGLRALPHFRVVSEKWMSYKTLIAQEMLKHGILASNGVYVCTEHTAEVVDLYFERLSPIFARIRECEDGRRVEDLLDGPVCVSGFKRLN